MAHMISTEEFEQLYRDTAAELFAYLRRRAVPEPEDMVAEVYMVAWRRRADLPPAFLRRAWLFGTARKLLLAQGRQRSRGHVLNELAALTNDASAVGTSPNNRQLEGVVAAALARLTRQDRELILLVEWDHMTPAEVAIVLGVRPGTVRVRLHRARQALAADPGLLDVISRRPEHNLGDQPCGVATAAG